jgi:putative phage-type endonuclease
MTADMAVYETDGRVLTADEHVAELAERERKAEHREWLAWRREGIGASDVPAILGLSPWASPWSVWANKVGLLPDEESTAIQERGQMLELAIGPWFEKRTGLKIVGQQERCVHPEWPIARCTLDGLVYDGGRYEQPLQEIDLHGGVEMKASQRSWRGIPEHYQAQAQWQMYVRGLQRVWFAVITNFDLDIFELLRDEDDINYMVERVRDFHERHILTGEPPATDDHEATERALAAVYPNHTPEKKAELDPADIAALRNAKQRVAAACAMELELTNRIRAAMGDAEVGVIGDQRVLTLRQQSRSGLDSKALAEQHPRIARKFAKSTSFRVLRLRSEPRKAEES